MTLAALNDLAARHALTSYGHFATKPPDTLGQGTLVLLGPAEPGFWPHVTAQPEFQDNQPDPLDRWSSRVITELANAVRGTAYFPFGDPVHPFISWALRAGRTWQSPVVLLVHETAGLMVSFRGAIHLPNLELPQIVASRPCDTCPDKPCLTACPVGALSAGKYDIQACHSFLETEDGHDDLVKGCAVRRACPISQNYGRSEQQSAYHMQQFHPWP